MNRRAMIGLGSNLQNPRDQVKQALIELDNIPNCRRVQQSSLYRSAPMGPADQPEYINAVAELETDLGPHALLDALQLIEQQHGRVREGERWGPRTLDLDLLLYGNEVINDERLQVPHPGIAERAFVLYPLAEIAPDLYIPGLDKLQKLLENCPETGLYKL